MGRHGTTIKLIELTAAILTAEHPMTVRQVYDQLVSRQAIENARGAYNAVFLLLAPSTMLGFRYAA